MTTLILNGCTHCGGTLAPDETVHNEWRGVELKCLNCGRVAASEPPSQVGRRAAPRGPQFHHRRQ